MSVEDDDILGVIDQFRDERGYAPTQREIADQLGVTDRAIRKRLNRMSEAGEVVWERGKRRTLRTNMKGRTIPL